MKLYELQIKNFWIKNDLFQTENYYRDKRECKIALKEILEDCDKKDVRILVWERTGEVL
jgi:hypothetical protein